MSVLRTLLFTPGNHTTRIEKALVSGADAVILDLEESIPSAEKENARSSVAEALRRPRSCLSYVRVNAADTHLCYGDLVAIVQSGLDGILLPKVETAETLWAIDWLIGQLERDRNLPSRKVDLIPMIETARGVTAVDHILSGKTRVRRVAFGSSDLALDLNMVVSANEAELNYARSKVVISSRAADLEAPIDAVWVDLKDVDGLERSARLARGLGFQGKMCIHPGQLPSVTRIFTPSDEEVAVARNIVSAFVEAEVEGVGAFMLDGKFVDHLIYRQAQRTLEIAARHDRSA